MDREELAQELSSRYHLKVAADDPMIVLALAIHELDGSSRETAISQLADMIQSAMSARESERPGGGQPSSMVAETLSDIAGDQARVMSSLEGLRVESRRRQVVVSLLIGALVVALATVAVLVA